MDTSQEYILMYQKAEEIRGSWKPKVGDWITFPKVRNKKGEHPCTCVSGFTEVTTEGNFEVLAYWRCYMLADENAPDIFLKEQKFLASNWKKHIFELENNLQWLPRQDELQEMILDKENSPISELKCLVDLSSEGPEGEEWIDEYWEGFSSMEQLWLAYVMKENYNKIWNGKDWIKNENSR